MNSEILVEEFAEPVDSLAAASSGATSERLPLSVIVPYGLLMVPLAFMSALAGMYLLKFTADVLLIAPGAFATLFAISKIFDAISDPVVGYLSDRTRQAAGRRRPWIFVSAIPIAMTFWAVWSPPGFLDSVDRRAMALWIGLAIILYYTAHTLAAVPHLALGAELSNDHHERTRVFGARGIFDVVGLFAAAGAIGWMQTSDDPRRVGQLIASVFAVVTIAVLWTGVRSVRERSEYRGRGSQAPLRALADVARNPHARIVLGVVTLESMSLSLLGAMFPFVTEYSIPDGAISANYVVGAIAAAMVIFPIWFPLARRFGKRAAWLVALTMKSVGFVFMFLARPDTMWMYPVAMVLIGGSLACYFVLPPSVKADVIDYDELQTGERKEGSYFAVWNFIQKFASAVAIAMSGIVLHFAGYEANVVQSEASINAMRGLFAGMPLALHVLAIVLLLRFRLDASEHQRIRLELDRRRRPEGN